MRMRMLGAVTGLVLGVLGLVGQAFALPVTLSRPDSATVLVRGHHGDHGRHLGWYIGRHRGWWHSHHRH